MTEYIKVGDEVLEVIRRRERIGDGGAIVQVTGAQGKDGAPKSILASDAVTVIPRDPAKKPNPNAVCGICGMELSTAKARGEHEQNPNVHPPEPELDEAGGPVVVDLDSPETVEGRGRPNRWGIE